MSLPKNWNGQKDKSLYAELKNAEREYMTVAAAYDAALSRAHRADEGTPEKIRHLKQAHAITNEMMAALNRYQAAVARLTELYSRPPINGRSVRT